MKDKIGVDNWNDTIMVEGIGMNVSIPVHKPKRDKL